VQGDGAASHPPQFVVHGEGSANHPPQ
jgi:hypothetical protein